MSVRQKLLGEPRRQADQLIAALKQRIANERSEWSRRMARQAADFQESLAKPLQAVEFVVKAASDREQAVALADKWLIDFHAWWAQGLETWAQHVAALVESKTDTAVEGELAALASVAGKPMVVPKTAFPSTGAMTGYPLDLTSLQARFDVPGAVDVIFESFRGGLYAVAMISGMIIIPAATVLMKSQSPLMRAGVAVAAVIPAAFFAVRNGRKVRQQLIAASSEKHREKIRRDLDALLKQRVERFKADAERYAHAYLAQRQQDMVSAIEPAVVAAFEDRERGLTSQLAKTQMESERIADQLGQLRTVKANLTTQVMVDLRRLALETAAKR